MAKNGQVKKGDRVEITRICGTGTKRRRQTLVDCTLNNRSKKWKCRAEKTIALKGK
jgi:hypothetical protein